MKYFLCTICFISFIGTNAQYVFRTEIDTNNAAYQISNVIQNADTSYILAGIIIGAFTQDFDCSVVKLSPQGKVLWSKHYPMPFDEFNAQIVHAHDSGYILSATTYSYPEPDNDGVKDIIVLKLDTDGNEEWRKVLPAYDHYYTIKSPDSTYVIIGNYKDSINDMSIIVYKIDIYGNIVWTNKMGTNGWDTPFHSKIYCDEQANIYFGFLTDSGAINYLHGFFCKISANGNLIYKKFFPEHPIERHLVGPIHIFALKGKHYYNRNNGIYEINLLTGDENLVNQLDAIAEIHVLGDNISMITTQLGSTHKLELVRLNEKFSPYWSQTLTETKFFPKDAYSCSDNGNLFVFGVEEITGNHKTIIIKTDCNGNYDEWKICALHTEENIVEQGVIRVYPNPVRSEIFIIVSQPGEYLLRLIDVNGRELLTQNRKIESNSSISATHLPQGVYFLSIYNKNTGDMHTEKIIKY
jgi:hypothetical protein